MKAGARVIFVQPTTGASAPAVVTAVVGTGPVTLAKRLDLVCDGHQFLDVPHMGDGDAGDGFWVMPEAVGTVGVPADSVVVSPPAPPLPAPEPAVEVEVQEAEVVEEQAEVPDGDEAGDDGDDEPPVRRPASRRKFL